MEIDLHPSNNVATFNLAPGYELYKTFIQQAGVEDDSNPICMDAQLISDDENSSTASTTEHPDSEDWNDGWDSPEPEGAEGAEDSEGDDGIIAAPREVSFDNTPSDAASSESMYVDPDEEDKLPSADNDIKNVAAELLRVHHQFNHISFGKLQSMAKCGILPKRLSKCPIPICSACMYGKATRRPWRDKPKTNTEQKLRAITYAGQCVSVDMIKSPVPGLIAQMAGWITGKRYNYATVYVDHFSRLGYVHLQKTQTAKETLEGKALFERRCASFGIKVQHYHADNGVFASLSWKETCALSGQGYSYSGVNAHFQSGVAERRIRELQELA